MTQSPITGQLEQRPIIDSTFDAVLFDMDGTLINSTPAVRRSWLKWGAEYGLDSSFREGSHGQPARDIVVSLIPEEKVEEAFLRIQAIEIEEVGDITILPGASEALQSIPENRKAIVTSCTRDLAIARIAASGIIAPTVVVTVSDVANGKPHPEPFLLGATTLGFDPARCLVIEDATAGLIAGRAAGCHVLGVAGTHTATHLAGDGVADLVVEKLSDVIFIETSEGILVTRA